MSATVFEKPLSKQKKKALVWEVARKLSYRHGGGVSETAVHNEVLKVNFDVSRDDVLDALRAFDSNKPEKKPVVKKYAPAEMQELLAWAKSTGASLSRLHALLQHPAVADLKVKDVAEVVGFLLSLKGAKKKG